MSLMASAEPIILRPGETRGRLDHALKVGAAETGGAYALRAAASFGLEQVVPGAANADYAGLDPAIHAALARKYGMEFV
jgi:hypothetical protein